MCLFSRHRSVIEANMGIASQILQKLWVSENGPIHYMDLDSWVNIWAIPHALCPTFLKNRLEFWTKFFRAIFLTIKAHVREVSSKSEMVTWRRFWKVVHLSQDNHLAIFTYNFTMGPNIVPILEVERICGHTFENYFLILTIFGHKIINGDTTKRYNPKWHKLPLDDLWMTLAYIFSRHVPLSITFGWGSK